MRNILLKTKTAILFGIVLILGITSCTEKEETVIPEKLPVAEFSADKTTGKTPLIVKFTNTSSDATKFSWDFGDGSSTSTEREPSHTFSNTSTTSARSFTVTLTARNDAGKSSTISKTINVEASVKPPTPAEMLTAGPWSMTAYSTYDGTTTVDEFFKWLPCEKDDIYVFNINGNYTVEEGKTKCKDSDPTIFDSGTWSLTSGSPIKLILDGDECEFLEMLTSTSMKIKYMDRSDPNNPIQTTITFVR